MVTVGDDQDLRLRNYTGLISPSIACRCKLASVIAEVDRILRPEGKLIVRDNVETIAEIEDMAKSLHWNIRMTYNKEQEGLLCVEKTLWRPTEVETLGYTFKPKSL
ncbi:hypothetical protein SSX86_029967 [Deinandra increscens subsp. villosa]|uniref:Methyltransferase n=1 Tax=Deinandra increscens subsp. villosa TaxID=3103831 RepID=A0AAP0CHI9_9ASTR